MSDKKPHSVPVPQLYKEASRILKRLEAREGSLKTLVYGSKYKNYRKIYAVLQKAWNHSSRTKHILAASKLFKEQPNFDPHLAQVLTSELLEKGSLSGDCKPVQVLLKYEEELKSLAANTLCEEKEMVQSRSHYPRYVRVNTLVASVEAVRSQLAEEGWWALEYDRNQITYDHFLHLMENLKEHQYLVDYHLPELLVFPPNTPFWDSVLYRENAVILQDKASCLPVFISNIRPGASVLDACAAPGNKTSQIAALINNTGRVIASEKSFSRYKTLKKLLHQRGASCVTTVNKDFTKLPQDLTAGIEHIFLDPTCSSSGK
ncbi:28S rRNA (cytosine-C(5))-methyltransferase-like isoform X2 [Eriocheir sinensis]|uniref:28S rRNA (cytosine-C(5))-methyltransferase-like isoform X2 n=1 Tax=Eriocheir sinensis TaxID=95602 RepID=UPI0021CA58C9|nr:28S rRNA (cytosine-C(5))-methyltransferase-like isoform X2 [Eriocheir sinensis]